MTGRSCWSTENFYEEFSDIYIDMPIHLETFIEMMLKDKSDYPTDGYDAEKYL